MWGRRRRTEASCSTNVPPHLTARFKALLALPAVEPSGPWRKSSVAAVGGLRAIGFGEDSDLLLVASWQGRGLFDCLSGTRVDRDDDPDFEEDLSNCRVQGIGALTGLWVTVAGHHGGGLAKWSPDGWSCDVLPLTWPNESVLVFPQGRTIWDDRDDSVAGIFKLTTDVLVAYGFSPTGRSFVLATSSDVTIYSR